MQNQELVDFVGAESYVDFVMDMDFTSLTPVENNGGGGRRRTVAEKGKKEYPPPISPCKLRRYCTGDGRLIIREEKFTCHEYFQARRENGRLVLDLVTFNDDEEVSDGEEIDGNQEFEGEQNVEEEDGGVMEGQDVIDEVEDDDRPAEDDSIILGGGGCVGGAAKCGEFTSSIGTGSCGFEVTLAALISTVHI